MAKLAFDLDKDLSKFRHQGRNHIGQTGLRPWQRPEQIQASRQKPPWPNRPPTLTKTWTNSGIKAKTSSAKQASDFNKNYPKHHTQYHYGDGTSEKVSDIENKKREKPKYLTKQRHHYGVRPIYSKRSQKGRITHARYRPLTPRYVPTNNVPNI